MDFEISGHKYRSDKLDAFQQFHVARKLAPVIGAIGPALGGEGDMSGLAKAIAELEQADCDFVLHTCLGAVRREQGGGYAPVFSAAAKRMMFSDINMLEMIQIAIKVIEENLASFTGALPSNFTVAVK